MMTREEAKERMDFDSNAERMSTKRNNALIDKIYDSFEQHIKSLEAQLANTEQLTCKNCYHSTIHNELFRSCRCASLIDEDGEPTSIVPNEFYCRLHHPKDTKC